MMEFESYILLLKVYEKCHNLVLFSVLDQDKKGQPIFPNLVMPKKSGLNLYQRYKKVSQKFLDNNYIYDMPPLTNKDLKRLLIDMAPNYQQS